MSSEEPAGKVTDFFWKRNTVRIEVLNGTVQEGDQLHVTGEYTDVSLDVDDMEVDGESVQEATEGEIFALDVSPGDRVVLGDEVYVEDED
jgi:translation initiation factor IF-2